MHTRPIHVVESTLGNCNKFEAYRVETNVVRSQNQLLFISEHNFFIRHMNINLLNMYMT